MAFCKADRPLRLAALALALPLASALAADLPASFEAEYELYRNGKQVGETRVRFSAAEERWTLESESEGTRGLARMLGLEERSRSEGRWQDGEPRPERFEQQVKAALKDRHTTADFNWNKGQVLSTHHEGETRLDLPEGAVDPGTVGLRLRLGLADGEQAWELPVVDEDEVETQRFEARTPERLDTGLGCMEVRRVERIRAPESRRYTHTFHATELDFIPVRVVHGKQEGDRMETRLTALTIDGQAVRPRPACEDALQG